MYHSQEVLLTSKEKPRFTGRKLVMLNPEVSLKRLSNQAKVASLKLANFSDYNSPDVDFSKAFEEADGIVFEKLGIAVINENRDRQVSMLTASTATTVVASLIQYSLVPWVSLAMLDYLRLIA